MAQGIETVIVGGGQAGLSISYYLTQMGREHVVLEKSAGPAYAWREQRWDSFTLVTPNWTFMLPGCEYDGNDPGGFMQRGEIVRRFEDYATGYRLPVTCNTAVTAVEEDGQGGYHVRTSAGDYQARSVVIANGFYAKGYFPPFAAKIPADIVQMHSCDYRSPRSLPEGAVLVVGAGQSGMQIAEELHESGRKVFLSTSPVAHILRRYRGRDFFDWLYASGFFERTYEAFRAAIGPRFIPPQLTGKDGGHELDFHQFYRGGITLLGHAVDCVDGKLILAGDLQENLRKSDAGQARLLKAIDDYIARAGIDAPQETVPPQTAAYAAPERESLDLAAEGITTIIWSCGFRYDASIVRFPVLNDMGFPVTHRGASEHPGLYFAGLPFISKLKSGFLFGVAEDAQYIAEHITRRAQ